MTYKPNLSRLARLAAGSRMPLPGQDPLREEELRIELIEEFKPDGQVEKIWVEDIAYRVAVIEVIRAQTAGFNARMIRKSYHQLDNRTSPELAFQPDPHEGVFSRDEGELVARLALRDFHPPERASDLAKPAFALLAGDLNRNQLEALRLLQEYEHDEVRKRDRIVNQLERRRRLAMQHAIAIVEARRRLGLLEDNARDATADAVQRATSPVADALLIEEATA